MLILHPSSRCDVCLDAYTWQTIAQTPHAIPCGHVFCRPCLFALSPYICPLCRKRFEPNKAKKLHVDRPENVDDNRENDLLQRLAVSWEIPEDQLRPLMFEVDTWLDTRADDTCIALRKARAALTRHIELKKAETTLEDAINDVHASYKDMTIAYEARHQQAVASETKLMADNKALIRENEDLKTKVDELRTASEQYGLKKPLPPPPVPISTKYIPTVAQAMAQDRVRFDFPPLPTDSPYTQFELEGRKRHKGKTKSASHQLISPDSQDPQPLPTQLSKMDLSEENHHSPRQRRISTPSSGLKLQFDHTNQPLDGFELTQTYLRGFSQGVSDGQLLVERAPPRSSRSHQPRASTSQNRNATPLPDNNESIETRSMQSTRSTQSREIQTSTRPHRNQNTVSPPIGQRGRGNRTNHPRLVALLSNDVPSPPSHSTMPSLPTSPLIHSPNPSFQLPSQASHGQQPEIPEIYIQPNPAIPESPAVSQISSWGTFVSTSSNFTAYSFLGLRDFRAGSYPHGSEAFSSPTSHAPFTVGMIPAHEMVGGSDVASPRLHGRNGTRINSERLSQYPPPPPSLNSWHGSAASLSPAQSQDQFSSSNGYHSDDETEIGLPNHNYIRESTNGHLRTTEPQRMTRGRNQPLPAVSPSFLFGEPIIAEEDNRPNLNPVETFGNALGLELTTGPTPISAPTPIVPHQSFLRSFSDGA